MCFCHQRPFHCFVPLSNNSCRISPRVKDLPIQFRVLGCSLVNHGFHIIVWTLNIRKSLVILITSVILMYQYILQAGHSCNWQVLEPVDISDLYSPWKHVKSLIAPRLLFSRNMTSLDTRSFCPCLMTCVHCIFTSYLTIRLYRVVNSFDNSL